ncbi:hypothetical protein DFJ58DRAFT_729453 [Suillus subalutaceus]|uniref:uncharacterized protein n=1 Tax=Suillus subalutaceus TaxID=48586 RepID=UPI001B862864|nr:uncharacterized protein DFJ58DRAFT_729453 [Suillus subalutaceus]KAG1849668.1 hypothetical protein DFJ58DRAFT_729453 [Suillus subalutaceus]
MDFTSHKVYTTAQKLSRVYTEWMTADHAWEMQHVIDTSTLEIPRVRFVDAGVALGYSQHNTGWKQETQRQEQFRLLSSQRAHFIDDNEVVFTKFIHNMDCVPSLDEDEYGYDLAVFLAFT